MRHLVAALVMVTSVPASAAPHDVDVSDLVDFLVRNHDFSYNRTHDGNPENLELPQVGKVAPEQFRFDPGNTYRTPADSWSDAAFPGYDTYETVDDDYAVAKDGSAAWATKTIVQRYGCNDGVPGQKCDIAGRQHAAILVGFDKAKVQPIASHVAYATDATRGMEAPLELPEDALATAAKPVADLFSKTIGSPASLVKTVSARKDVVLLGSVFKERYVGGPAVRARLASWNLSFKVRDHVAAGLASPTTAWVAANLDAGKTSYRALFVYELTDHTWQLVQASFSLPGISPK